MRKIKTHPDARGYRDLKTRPTTTTEAISRRVPPRTIHNIWHGHIVKGSRDIPRIGWKPWEKTVADTMRTAERRRYERTNRHYHALGRIQALLEGVRRRSDELQRTTQELGASNEELGASNEELQSTNEELESTNEELNATTEELELTSAYLQTLVDAMLDILMTTDPSGIITQVNLATERISGYSREELVGQPFRRFFTDPERAQAGVEQVVAEGEVSNYDLTVVAKDGRQALVSYNATALRDADGRVTGVVGCARDITQSKQAEEALRSASAYNRSLIEASLDPLVTIDLEGKIIDLNGAAEKVTGFTREELIGTDFSDYFAEPEKARAGYRQGFREGVAQDYVLEIRRRDGNVTPVLLYNVSAHQDEAGEVIGAFVAMRDITDRKKAEEMQREAEDALKKQTKELVRSNAELEQFAYVAAHDLQEPLRMISSYVQLLEQRYKGKLDSDADEYIAYAVDGANRMQGLINGLLTYARVSTRGKDLTPVDTEDVFERAIANLKVAIEESGGTVTHDPLPTVIADDRQLVQLFQNLIGNAIKFRGEARLHVHVSAGQTGEEWVFSVRDNGIGIDPEQFERIFVIFQRLHPAAEYQGSGIGLSIAKKIVERHDGRIWVESKPGEGSTLYFTLPVRDA